MENTLRSRCGHLRGPSVAKFKIRVSIRQSKGIAGTPPAAAGSRSVQKAKGQGLRARLWLRLDCLLRSVSAVRRFEVPLRRTAGERHQRMRARGARKRALAPHRIPIVPRNRSMAAAPSSPAQRSQEMPPRKTCRLRQGSDRRGAHRSRREKISGASFTMISSRPFTTMLPLRSSCRRCAERRDGVNWCGDVN